jgi:hypothetical protein
MILQASDLEAFFRIPQSQSKSKYNQNHRKKHQVSIAPKNLTDVSDFSCNQIKYENFNPILLQVQVHQMKQAEGIGSK